MKNIIYIATLLLCFSKVFSQNIIINNVEYKTELNLGLPTISYSLLSFDNENSLYEQGNFTILSKIKNIKEENLESSQKEGDKIYLNTRTKEIKSLVRIDELFFLVDELNYIEWNILDDTKEINGFQCQKANCDFRGRKYYVWFTNDIPVSVGPWKLNGLPGLILEAIDDKESVKFTAVKVSFNIENTNTFLFKPSAKVDKKLSLREFVEIRKEIELEKIQILISQLPKESIVSGFQEGRRENNIEVKYEWE